MRVLEPRYHFKAKRPRQKPKGKLRVIILLIFALATVVYLIFGQPSYTQNKNKEPNAQVLETAPTDTAPKKLKNFTGAEFKALYSSFAYPNTQALSEKPVITGNSVADEKIRQIAEEVGYKLSAVPVSNIVKIDEPGLTDDDLIQPLALIAWQDLKAAAGKENIPLQITSAYRSIEFQRALFLRRLADAGISIFGIADGYSDGAVAGVLSRAAAPGYSRHHTGYTIDLACNGVGLESFKSTSCYAWLSNNNFENTKKFGWVPSYPEEAERQGPEPEPWEYIWVGTSSLYE